MTGVEQQEIEVRVSGDVWRSCTFALPLSQEGLRQRAPRTCGISVDRGCGRDANLASPRRPPLVLIGASKGVKASIIAAARSSTLVTAVVSLSAERYFRDGTDVKAGAAKLTRPILFVMASHDPYAADDTPTLYRACTSPDKKLLTVAGDAHGVDLLGGKSGGFRMRRDPRLS